MEPIDTTYVVARPAHVPGDCPRPTLTSPYGTGTPHILKISISAAESKWALHHFQLEIVQKKPIRAIRWYEKKKNTVFDCTAVLTMEEYDTATPFALETADNGWGTLEIAGFDKQIVRGFFKEMGEISSVTVALQSAEK